MELTLCPVYLNKPEVVLPMITQNYVVGSNDGKNTFSNRIYTQYYCKM